MAATPEFGVDVRIQQMIDHLPDAVMMFDTDLRLLLAGGRPLTDYGYDPTDIVGRTLAEILPPDSYDQLIDRYRLALSGTALDFVFSSEIVGGRFHVRIEPLRDDAGEVVGALSVTTDIAPQEGMEFELERARHLLSIGSAAFERRKGWVIDSALLDMWGLGDIAEPSDVIASVVVPEDREAVAASWERLASTGGRTEIDYRIVHGRTGEIREMHGTTNVLIGADGAVLRAITTQMDVTDMNRSRTEADRVRAASERYRDNLLQQVVNVLATTGETLEESLRSTAEFAATAIGEGCAVRVLGADGRSVDQYCISHQNPDRQRDWEEWQELELRLAIALPEFIQEATATRRLVSGSDHTLAPGEPAWFDHVRFMAAPIRLGGQVLGVMTIARANTEREFDSVEERLVQVMADRLGAIIAADRERARADRERANRDAIGELLQSALADQRDLVLQLDRTESRERELIAEAIHDEPLQLVVAAMLRLDNLRDRLAEPEEKLIDGVAANLETAIQQLRNLIVAMAPPDLTAGLGAALRSFAESTFVGTSTQVTTTGPDHVHLDPRTKLSVFRIVREAMVNVRKHAAASEVALEVVETATTVVIRVSDNGVGMSHAVSRPGHLGLASMRARAEAAHADLTLTCPPTGGTVVEVTLQAQYGGEVAGTVAAGSEFDTEPTSTMKRRLT